MDKFGIFNLIGSLLSNKDNKNTPINSTESGNPLDFSGLLNALAPTKNTPTQATPSCESPKEFAPLQHSMISVMSSHDEIIRRVKEKSQPHTK